MLTHIGWLLLPLAYFKYRCSTYNNQTISACSYRSIHEDELETIVLNQICEFSKIVVSHSEKLVNKLTKINNRIKNISNGQIQCKIRRNEKELQSIKPKVDVLLSQMVNGNIFETKFKQFMNEYEAKKISIKEQLINFEAKMSNAWTGINNTKILFSYSRQNVY